MDIDNLDRIVFYADSPSYPDTLLKYISSQFYHKEIDNEIIFDPDDLVNAEFIFNFFERILPKLTQNYNWSNDYVEREISGGINANRETTSLLIESDKRNQLWQHIVDVNKFREIVRIWHESNGLEIPKKLRDIEWQGALKGFVEKAVRITKIRESNVEKRFKMDSSTSLDNLNYSKKTSDISERDEEIKRLNRTVETSYKIIRKMKRRHENKLGELSDHDFENLIEPHRFNNGRLNMTKAGKALNVSNDTIRREIERRRMKHIINQPKNN